MIKVTIDSYETIIIIVDSALLSFKNDSLYIEWKKGEKSGEEPIPSACFNPTITIEEIQNYAK